MNNVNSAHESVKYKKMTQSRCDTTCYTLENIMNCQKFSFKLTAHCFCINSKMMGVVRIKVQCTCTFETAICELDRRILRKGV